MLTVAPITSSPGPTSTGTGSPVIIDTSIAECPSTTMPSVATFSPGPHDEPHADLEVVERRSPCRPRACRLDAEVGECPDRVAGSALGPDLEPLAEQDERDDHGGGLEVDVCIPSSPPTSTTVDHVQAANVPIDTSVSIVVRAVTQVHRRGPVERPPAPEHDGRGERGDHPFPPVEQQGRDHRDQHHGHAEHDRHDESPPEVVLPLPFGAVLIRFLRRVVAELFDGVAEPPVVRTAVVDHDRPAVGEVDPGVIDAVEVGERSLDTCWRT